MGDNSERRKWTEEEDNILREEVKAQRALSKLTPVPRECIWVNAFSKTELAGLPLNWTMISEKLSGHSNRNCRNRWSKCFEGGRKGAWAEDEDDRLRKAVESHGTRRWTQVAQIVGTRHADQCAKRWQHSLDPNVNRNTWTQKEDDLLEASVNEIGRNWRHIASTIIPGRSTTDLKNRYELICRRQQSQKQSGETDDAEAVGAASNTDAAGYEQTSPSSEPNQFSDTRFQNYNGQFAEQSSYTHDLSSSAIQGSGFSNNSTFLLGGEAEGAEGTTRAEGMGSNLLSNSAHPSNTLGTSLGNDLAMSDVVWPGQENFGLLESGLDSRQHAHDHNMDDACICGGSGNAFGSMYLNPSLSTSGNEDSHSNSVSSMASMASVTDANPADFAHMSRLQLERVGAVGSTSTCVLTMKSVEADTVSHICGSLMRQNVRFDMQIQQNGSAE